MKHYGTLLVGFLCLAQLATAQPQGNAPGNPSRAQEPRQGGRIAPGNTTNASHAASSAYAVPYGLFTAEDVKTDLDRVLKLLEENSPKNFVDRESGNPITDYKKINANSNFPRGRFGILGYEWGVTYSGMLKVAQFTGDQNYAKYVYDRFAAVGGAYPNLKKIFDETGNAGALRSTINPGALDDAGSICASMIKGSLANPSITKTMQPVIENYFNWVMYKEYRLADGTLARKRPHYNSVWLDDMYMGIPAIAYMGKFVEKSDPALSAKCFDEAARQIALFKEKMWVPESNLFRHGWVEAMSEHPAFFWGRANGWGILTLSDVLDVLPQNHKDRAAIMELYKSHIRGIAKLQSGDGFWHQLLDRNDSYLETSATAIFTYCIAHGINEGWLDPLVYGPVAQLGWAAVKTKINEAGEVEGTCVGTGMAFDPAFYYYRNVSVNAAHGYGPVLLAGSEMIRMANTKIVRINDSAVQFYNSDPGSTRGIFSVEKP